MQLNVQFLGDASKNCIAWVRGVVEPKDEGEWIEFLDIKDIAPAATGRRPKTLQLASALWVIQEKLGLRMWSDHYGGPENLLLIMESRNFIRLDRPYQLADWQGKLWIEPFNVSEVKWFQFQLDFDKVMER